MMMTYTIESKDLPFQFINVTYSKHKWNYFYKKNIHRQPPLTFQSKHLPKQEFTGYLSTIREIGHNTKHLIMLN